MKLSLLIKCIMASLFVLSSTGCDSAFQESPEISLSETSLTPSSYDETIRINNCGAKVDSTQTSTRSFATTIEGGLGFKVDYKAVEGSILAKYSRLGSTAKTQTLTAPADTNMEFVLRWSEEVHGGNVTVNGVSKPYQIRIPISVEQLSVRDLGNCPKSQNIINLQPTLQSANSAVVSATVTPIPYVPKPTQAPQLATFVVYANLSWQNTGVQIKSGDRLRIVWEGKGKWRGVKQGDFSDPLGNYDDPNSNYACPPLLSSHLAGWNGLVSKVGQNGIPTNPFKSLPTGEGFLFLAMNDCDQQRYDNEGSIEVTIEVQR